MRSKASEKNGPAARAGVVTPARIALVDECEQTHNRLRSHFQAKGVPWTLQSYFSAVEAISAISPAVPNVVLVHDRLPDLSGTELLRRVKAKHPALHTAILTRRNEAAAVFEALAANPGGCVVWPVPEHELHALLAQWVRGTFALCQRSCGMLTGTLSRAGDSGPLALLTPRERQVLACVRECQTNKEISATLGIGLGTVHTHLVHLFDKLGVHTRSEALDRFKP
jgi:DNA-binding NarL/FixJ family response regulator